MTKNQYGLSRIIAPEVKFEVRKRSGFGCVVCGLGIYHYDHIDPEFKEAKKHDPAGITLLCGRCHDRKTRKFLSVRTVKEAMKNPKALQAGFTKEILDVGGGYPTLMMGDFKFQNVLFPLVVEGRPLFGLFPPEISGAPFRFCADFLDSTETDTLRIINNEWYASSGNWDIETVGGKLMIKEENGNPHLILKTLSPDAIMVEYLRMTYQGYSIEVDEKNFSVTSPGGASKVSGMNGGGEISNTKVGLTCQDGIIRLIVY